MGNLKTCHLCEREGIRATHANPGALCDKHQHQIQSLGRARQPVANADIEQIEEAAREQGRREERAAIVTDLRARIEQEEAAPDAGTMIVGARLSVLRELLEDYQR